jgi:hypothetical protein
MKKELTEEQKELRRAYKRKWEKEKKEKMSPEEREVRRIYINNWKKEKNKKLTPEEKTNRKEYQEKWRKENREHLAQWHRDYRKKNPESNKINTKNYRKNNPEKSKQSTKKYKDRNKDKVEAYRKKYKTRKNELQKIKKTTDPLFALSTKIRQTILKSLGRKTKGSSRTEEILGCSFSEFKKYIESKFQPWMSWDNRGKYNGELNYGWDLDHIMPLASAKTEKEIIALNHHTNFQPLCSKINRDIKRNN